MVSYKAVYPYEPRDPVELQLVEGETVVEVEKVSLASASSCALSLSANPFRMNSSPGFCIELRECGGKKRDRLVQRVRATKTKGKKVGEKERNKTEMRGVHSPLEGTFERAWFP